MTRPLELWFSQDDSIFYTEPFSQSEPSEVQEEFSFPVLSLMEEPNWKIEKLDPWVYCSSAEVLPEQGWKLHVSTVPDEAFEVLSLVAEVLFEMNVSFKYLRNDRILRKTLSKYGDRGQAGKFLTIYPTSDNSLTEVCQRLSDLLRGRNGCDILTDCRIPSTTLHARYGGFKLQYIKNHEGESVPAILDDKGNLVPDRRGVGFYIPEWVPVPPILSDAVKMRVEPTLTMDDFYPYCIENALHHSNAGGVYTAKDLRKGSHVVFKEARPYVGLDDSGDWAVDRLEREKEALKALGNIEAVVNFLDERTIGGHSFLIEEYIDAPNLTQWVAQNYPFGKSTIITSYFESAKSIGISLKKTLEEIHATGWVLLDLQPNNILIDENLNVRLIDLESAQHINSVKVRGIGTPGFVPAGETTGIESDWFAFNRVVAHLFCPLTPLNSLADDLIDFQIEFSENELPKKQLSGELFVLEDDSLRRKDILSSSIWSTNSTSVEFSHELVKGVQSVLSLGDENRPLPGDILAFGTNGNLSIACGVSSLLSMDNVVDEGQRACVQKMLDDNFVTRLNSGVTGLMSGYLYGEFGNLLFCSEELAKEVLARSYDIKQHYDNNVNDFSWKTGLSGNVLVLLALCKRKLCADSLLHEEASFLIEILNRGRKSLTSIHSTTHKPVGLFDGLLGCAVALQMAGNYLQDFEMMTAAKALLIEDMESLVIAPDGSAQLLDQNRLMPYIAEGSAGFFLAASLVPEFRQLIFSKLPRTSFLRAAQVRICANGGLLQGRAGLLASEFFGNEDSELDRDSFLSTIPRVIAPFTFRENSGNSGILIAGHGGLKLSADYSTGNIGVLKLLQCVTKGESAWGLFPGLEKIDSEI